MGSKINENPVFKIAFGAVLVSHSAFTVAAPDIVVDGRIRPAAVVGITGSEAFIRGEDHGVKSGSNLFFSFQKFNLNAPTDKATFSCSNGFCGASAGSIQNVISRINSFGNQGLSTINGEIAFAGTNLSAANLWLFNPQGVVIGSGAVINVPGAFHVGNATQLDFPGAGNFDLATTDVSSLTVAPGGFGFVGVDPDGAGATGTINPSNGVSLNGGTITTFNGPIEVNATTVIANGSTLNASTGSISISGTNLVVQDGSTTTLNSTGNLQIQESSTNDLVMNAGSGSATLTSAAGVKTLTSNADITVSHGTFRGNLVSTSGNLTTMIAGVDGNVEATVGDLSLDGIVTGSAVAGNNLTLFGGSVEGGATAGQDLVNSGTITGNAEALSGSLTNISNATITGDATAGTTLDNSGTISGKATANHQTSSEVGGSLTSGTSLINRTTGVIGNGAESENNTDIDNQGQITGTATSSNDLSNSGSITGNAVAFRD